MNRSLSKTLTAMKSVSLFLALLTLVCLTAQAQDEKTSRFGIKGGLNLSNFYQTEVGDENAKLGFHVGLFARAPIIEDVLSIQPEVLYTVVGSETQYQNFLQGSGKYRFNLGYVQIPVLAVVNIGAFNIHAGPYASILTNVNIKNVDGNGNVQGITQLDKDKFNGFDYGLAGGIGFDFKGASLGLRYNYGLREVGKDGGISLNTSTNTSRVLQNSKNSVFQAYVSFGF